MIFAYLVVVLVHPKSEEGVLTVVVDQVNIWVIDAPSKRYPHLSAAP